MYTGQIAVIPREGDWDSPIVEIADDDGTTTDLTDPALNLAIVVTIRSLSCGCRGSSCGSCVMATASIANGKVTVPGPGFQWHFLAASDLACLCAGTYRLVSVVTINGSPRVPFDGTIAVEG